MEIVLKPGTAAVKDVTDKIVMAQVPRGLGVTIATVKDVAEKIIIAQDHAGLGRTIFFIGAGCSVSAGVPAVPEIAQRMVEEIASKFRVRPADSSASDCYFALLHKDRIKPCFRDGFDPKNGEPSEADIDWHGVYDRCFEAHYCAPDDVRDLFARILSECHGVVNWAHMCLGELAAQKYISTVLTTNFDQLVLAGMASAGLLPVVCDGLESLNRLSPRPIHQQLVELHGSRHTYRLRNRPSDVALVAGQHSAISSIISLFGAATTFVVVGYGGREHGVMDLLVEAAKAYPDKNLFWIMRGREPSSLSEKARIFLSNSVNSAIVVDQDADIFFLKLCQEMGIGAPSAIREPLSRHREILKNIRRARIGDRDIEAEVTRSEELLANLYKAEERFLSRRTAKNVESEIRRLRLRGQSKQAYEAATKAKERATSSEPPSAALLSELVAAANLYGAEQESKDLPSALRIYDSSIAACHDLIALDKSQSARLLCSETYRKAGRAYEMAGDKPKALAHYRAALRQDRSGAGNSPDDVEVLDSLADSHQSMSDALLHEGDLAGAIKHIKSSLELRKRIVEKLPEDPQHQHNLSMIYDRLGDANLDGGDFKGARRNYELALGVDQGLAAREPDNPARQRSLSISYSKLGDLLVEEKNYKGARENYQASLAVIESLVATNSASSDFKRELSIAHLKLGDLARSEGDLAAVAEKYALMLSSFRELAAINPKSAFAARDLSAALSRVGQLNLDQGNFRVARGILEEAISIDTRLAASERAGSPTHRSLGIAYEKLGDLHRDDGDVPQSRKSYGVALALFENGAAENRASAESRRDVVRILQRIGMLDAEDEPALALANLNKSLTMARELDRLHPDHPGIREDIAFSEYWIAQLTAPPDESADDAD
jgi:tetratricopeptide (TPR) repeat protein